MDLNCKPPAENFFGLFNFLLAGFYLAMSPGQYAGLAVLLHLAVALALFRIPRPTKSDQNWWRKIRKILPFGLWAAAWLEIGWINGLLDRPGHDKVIMTLDRALFTSHWNEHLAEWLPWVWLNEFMHLSYLSYYLLIVGPVLYLAWRQPQGLPRHTANLMGTYLVCFAIYLVFPVLGPRSSLIASGQLDANAGLGFFPAIMESLFQAGDSSGTAFPSSHCAASLAAALSIRRYCRPRTSNLLLGWALLIAFSTVYTNNHYTIDAAAGLFLAWLVWRLGLTAERSQASGSILERALAGSAAMVMAGKMLPSCKEDQS